MKSELTSESKFVWKADFLVAHFVGISSLINAEHNEMLPNRYLTHLEVKTFWNQPKQPIWQPFWIFSKEYALHMKSDYTREFLGSKLVK